MCCPVLRVFLYECGAVLGAHLGVRGSQIQGHGVDYFSPGTLDWASAHVAIGTLLLEVVQFYKWIKYKGKFFQVVNRFRGNYLRK